LLYINKILIFIIEFLLFFGIKTKKNVLHICKKNNFANQKQVGMNNSKILTCCILAGFIITTILLFGSCKGNKGQNSPKSAVQYTTATIGASDITVYTQFPVQIESEDAVQIFPRATGYIQTIYVQEGSSVQKGSPILKINDADYRQAVNAAKAAYDNAELEVVKLQPLVEKNIISPLQLQTARSNVEAAQAAYENAKINLGYTLITSPVSGIVGRISLREGSLLTAGMSTPITTIASTGDVFAYFSFDEKRLLQLVNDSTPSSLKQKLAEIPPVDLVLANGDTYDYRGRIEIGSGLIDPSTGSLQLKGVFPNPQAILHSGSAGTIKIPTNYSSVIVVPQAATYDIQNKKMIFTVDSANVVHATNITVTNNTSDAFVVTSGLKAGDRIVLNGIGQIKDGDKIEIKQ